MYVYYEAMTGQLVKFTDATSMDVTSNSRNELSMTENIIMKP